MLDGVVLFQAKWRGMKARRHLEEFRFVSAEQLKRTPHVDVRNSGSDL